MTPTITETLFNKNISMHDYDFVKKIDTDTIHNKTPYIIKTILELLNRNKELRIIIYNKKKVI